MRPVHKLLGLMKILDNFKELELQRKILGFMLKQVSGNIWWRGGLCAGTS